MLRPGGPAFEDEGNLTIGHGVLGEIIVNDEGVLAVLHEPFSDGTACVGGQVLVGGVVRGRGGDNGDVVDGSGFLEHLDGRAMFEFF